MKWIRLQLRQALLHRPLSESVCIVMYRVVFYCSDTNLRFNGLTPDQVGMGGGKTALVRMAKALHDLGNEVTVYANSDPGNYDGVEYLHFSSFPRGSDYDILIVLTTSKLDLRDWDPQLVKSRLTILWIQGAAPIYGLDHTCFDYIYVVSAYLRNLLVSKWGIPSSKIFVTSNAFSSENVQAAQRTAPKRDKYGIVFASHPSKGLSRIIEIVDTLRKHDSRFYLDVYGGKRLWDTETSDDKLKLLDGEHIRFQGLVGQRELNRRLRSYNFMLAISDIPDGCSLTLIEAKKAGVLVLASAIGGNPEIIFHEYDGFLIEEDYLSPECKDHCVELILRLVNDEEYAEKIRSRAMAYPISWHVIAQEWINHWDTILHARAQLYAQQRSPAVSVVMPVYNGERYLKEAIDSILGQTFWGFEFIIVNDGSTDRTGELLRSYSDPRLVVIDQSHQGIGAALNRGIQYARGKYIARMDADDVSHPRRLQCQVEFLERHPDVALLGTSTYRIDANGQICSLWIHPTSDTDIKRELPYGNQFCHSSVMFRRAVLSRVGGYRKHRAEDYDLWLRISERYTVANLEAPLQRIRCSGSEHTALYRVEIQQEALKRYLQGQDSEGFPPLKHSPVFGLPLLDIRWQELKPYSQTLYAWGTAFLWKNNQIAWRLFTRAALLNPLAPEYWAALLKSWIIQHHRIYEFAWRIKKLFLKAIEKVVGEATY